MFESIVPGSLYHFACVGLHQHYLDMTYLILLQRDILYQSYILVNVKVEQRTRLAASRINDEVVKGIVL